MNISDTLKPSNNKTIFILVNHRYYIDKGNNSIYTYIHNYLLRIKESYPGGFKLTSILLIK